MNELVFHENSAILLGTNIFKNVPILLQFEATPLIQVIDDLELGKTTNIDVYHSDGTMLAKVKGTRIYKTKAGETADLNIEKYRDATICKLGDRTILEIEHSEGDLFKVSAELHTADGYLVGVSAEDPKYRLSAVNGDGINVGAATFQGNRFENVRIGILFDRNGTFRLGAV